MLNWNIKLFNQLTTDELYDLLKLRIDVFVVEQECFYPDLDEIDRDKDTLHVFAYKSNGERDEMVAYCRVLAPDIAYKGESAIGRVIVSESVRGQKVGYDLMNHAIEQVKTLWPNNKCHISAQQHLANFYQNLGFKQITEMYLEDDIPHIGMLRD